MCYVICLENIAWLKVICFNVSLSSISGDGLMHEFVLSEAVFQT